MYQIVVTIQITNIASCSLQIKFGILSFIYLFIIRYDMLQKAVALKITYTSANYKQNFKFINW